MLLTTLVIGGEARAESVDPGVNLIPITDQTEMLAGLNADGFIQLFIKLLSLNNMSVKGNATVLEVSVKH